MKSVGIIGFGSFGKFLAEKLEAHAQVRVFSQSDKPNQWAADLETVAQCDYVVLAVPLEAYERTLGQIQPYLRPETIIVDVCSVKVQPMAIIKRILPDQPVVATHPLFGPESAKDTVAGQTLVLCPEQSTPVACDGIESFALTLGLKVIRMSCDDHDQEMAVVQGLTFFIAHALKDLKLTDHQLTTPSFERLLTLADLETRHSNDLFLTIQAGNAKTKEVRKRFMELCKSLDASIED